MEELLAEVQDVFGRQLDLDSLLSHSEKLQAELRQHLKASEQCMLPSHNYDLPSGQEQGTYLALEVGGSNLRIAMVELAGRHPGKGGLRVRHLTVSPIDTTTRALCGTYFFDWMAARIGEVLDKERVTMNGVWGTKPLPMGVAWSFPIEQTSIRSGIVLGMGKGFRCSEEVKGRDLGDMMQQACDRAGVNVRLHAIVNDGSAALLARAYIDPSTRLAVILGTGLNAAIHIPVSSLSASRFAGREFSPGRKPSHVVTNTEFSMFGKDIFPTTRWDDTLNAAHLRPGYQPFEYLVAGAYISEIVRLILVEAADRVPGFYDGSFPPSLRTPYSLATKHLATLDTDPTLSTHGFRLEWDKLYPSPSPTAPPDAVIAFITHTLRAITRRSIAFFAAGVHALTTLMEDLDAEAEAGTDAEANAEAKAAAEAGSDATRLDHFTIGCDGSILNCYPRYMERAQETLDQLRLRLREREGRKLAMKSRKRVVLGKTRESAVLGAGVACAIAAGQTFMASQRADGERVDERQGSWNGSV